MILTHYLVVLLFLFGFQVAVLTAVDAIGDFFVVFVKQATATLRGKFIGGDI